LDEAPVALDVFAVQVAEQPPTLSNELEQPTTRVMIAPVAPEVLGDRVDALGEERYLDFGRPGVTRMRLEIAEKSLLGVLVQLPVHPVP